MADGIEETVGKVDTTKDPNEGKSMLDFVKSEIGVKPEDDAKSNAQELGKTEPSPEEEAARVEKEKADKEREELLANETLEEKTAREAKEKADKEAENEEAVEDEQVEEKDKG